VNPLYFLVIIITYVPLGLVGVDDGVALSIGRELEVAGVQHDLLIRGEREGEAAGAGSRDTLTSGVASH